MNDKRAPLANWGGTNLVIDTGWGDAGKGKIVDTLAAHADVIVRFNGGANAGHTVVNDAGEFKFHLIPSGIFNSTALSVIAGTVALDPFTLCDEICQVQAAGFEVAERNLKISRQAHLVMPWHIARDQLREKARGGGKIGTTGRGIGPLFADRTDRVGLRAGDLLQPDFEKRFLKEYDWQARLIHLMSSGANGQLMESAEKTIERILPVRGMLAPYITEILPEIWRAQDAGLVILGEGAQGMLLDLDLGGYPFVTSSHPGLAGFAIATGLHQREIRRVIGVTKAYQTRVGEGPMPTEDHGAYGEKLRRVGNEYGATTGRPRRCGYLDLPAMRYGARTGGVNSLAVTKLDVLDHFSELKVCVAYQYQGEEYPVLPTAAPEAMAEFVPVYEVLPGWQTDTTGIRTYSELPQQAQDYVGLVEQLAGIPVEIVSNGPERSALIVKEADE